MILTHHDYCAGTGAFSIAAARCGFHTTCIIEKKDHALTLLRKRFPYVTTIHTDLTTVVPELLDTPTVITAGIPCQPYSIAGQQLTFADPRHLWPSLLRVLTVLKPAWLVVENVDDFAGVELDLVRIDLAKKGYQSVGFVLPACAVGAPHRRDRLFIIAYSMSDRVEGRKQVEIPRFTRLPWIENFRNVEELIGLTTSFEPKLLRSYNDVSNGMDRLDLLGEAIIPFIAEKILSLIAINERSH